MLSEFPSCNGCHPTRPSRHLRRFYIYMFHCIFLRIFCVRAHAKQTAICRRSNICTQTHSYTKTTHPPKANSVYLPVLCAARILLTVRRWTWQCLVIRIVCFLCMRVMGTVLKLTISSSAEELITPKRLRACDSVCLRKQLGLHYLPADTDIRTFVLMLQEQCHVIIIK